MALTARRVSGEEAAAVGLVSRCFAGQREMMEAVLGVSWVWGDGGGVVLSGNLQPTSSLQLPLRVPAQCST
jgi:hypothetical protein